MSQINRSRLRGILASEGLTASNDPKLDFPSVSDPDRKAGTEKLYKKLEAFERKHGRSKALTKALEAVLNLNHALTVAENSLYRRLASGKTASRPPLDKEQIAEIEKEGWPDMMSQAEASDWAVNTIRQAWRERGMVGKPEQMMREEFDRIRKGNLDYPKYLRVSRAGSKFRLDRAMRRAIYIQYLAKNKKVKSELWRRLADKH